MNDSLSCTFEEELGYAVDERTLPRHTSERRGLAAKRQLSGRERCAIKARHSRHSSPQRNSGAHLRRNKWNYQ